MLPTRTLTQAQTDEKIKAVNDALSGHSGDKVAHITAEERTAWNAKHDRRRCRYRQE